MMTTSANPVRHWSAPLVRGTRAGQFEGQVVERIASRLFALVLLMGATCWTALAFLVAEAAPPRVPRSADAEPPPAAQKRPVAPDSDNRVDALPAGAALRFGTTKYRQEAPIHQILFSPDGRYFATGADDRQIRIWDATDGHLIRRVVVDEGTTHPHAWDVQFANADTLLLASIRLDRKEFAKGRQVFTLSRVNVITGQVAAAFTQTVPLLTMHVKISPNGRTVAVRRINGELQVLDSAQAANIRKFKVVGPDYRPLVFSPAGDRIAAVGEAETNNVIDIVDLVSNKKTRLIATQNFQPHRLAFSPDGKRLTASNGAELWRWNVDFGRLEKSIQAFMVNAAFSDDGRRVAGFNLGKLVVRDATTLNEVDSFETGLSNSTASALSPDGQVFATYGGPTVLHCWDIRTRRDRFALPEQHAELVCHLMVTPDGKTLVTSSDEPLIFLWDLASGVKKRKLEHKGEVQAIALSEDGRYLFVASEPRKFIYRWDLASEVPPVISGGGFSPLSHGSVVAIEYLSREDALLTATSDGHVRSWKFNKGELKKSVQPEFSKHDSPLNIPERFTHGRFFSSGRYLAINCEFLCLHVAEVDTGKELFAVTDAKWFAISPDQKTMAVWRPGDDSLQKIRYDRRTAKTKLDGSILLLDGITGRIQRQIDVPGKEVAALAFSPDGKILAVTMGWEKGEIGLFDAAMCKKTSTIDTSPFRSPGLVFTPDGKRLISAMADTSVLMWNIAADR